MKIQTLLKTMHALSESINSMAELELRLQEILLERKVFESEYTLREMEELSNNIIELEAQRDLEFQRLLDDLGKGEEGALEDLFLTLSRDEQALIASAYRSLKLAVARVKAATEGIDVYTRHHISMLKSVVDELYPERKQRTYNSRGFHRELGTPMILDHSL